MLNLDMKFYDFLEEIELSKSKREDLKKGRDAIREKVRSNFKADEILVPKFRMQGSYSMGTMVQALTDFEYDIDDGIYLQHETSDNIEEWEKTSDIHNKIFEIVKNHTNTVEDKNPCVRVTYAKNYHIDLPIYILKDDIAYLAHLKKGWIESDPKALKEWYVNKVKEKGEQLRENTRIIKAWKDFQISKNIDLDFCGLAISILIGNNYVDDISIVSSLCLTIEKISKILDQNYNCYKPVNPKDEDLFSTHNQTMQNRIKRMILELSDEIRKSLEMENEKLACEKLKEVFGPRFPSGSDKITNQKYIKTKAPAVLNEDARSA